MPLADTEPIDVLWIVLSVVFVVVGIAFAWLLYRLSVTSQRMTRVLETTETSVIPLADKLGTTLDRVNLQLDKLDVVTDSAVDAADAADTAVRAVSMAITRPVQKASALAKGLSHGTSALFAGNDLKTAMAAGRDAAARREQEIADELARTQARRTAYLRPESRAQANPPEFRTVPEQPPAPDTADAVSRPVPEKPPAPDTADAVSPPPPLDEP